MEVAQQVQGSDSSSRVGALADVLLAELKRNTDLAGLVERVHRRKVPWIVVPSLTVAAWEQRDPSGWAKVSAWLAATGVTVVRA